MALGPRSARCLSFASRAKHHPGSGPLSSNVSDNVMRYAVLGLLFLGFLNAPAHSSGSESRSVETAFQLYASVHFPELAPRTRFHLDRYEIPGLEEKLSSTAYLASFLGPNGRPFNELLLLFRKGEVTPFGTVFGGWGLMSAAVHGNCLYYTYSWGSGIHRSHVGRVSIVQGKLRILDSIGYQNANIFVKVSGQGVSAYQGEFTSFNQWRGDLLLKDIDRLYSDSLACRGGR